MTERAWWVWAGAEGGGHCHSQTGRPWQRMGAFFTLKGLVSLVRGVWIDGHEEFNIIRAKPPNGNAFTISFCLQAEVGDEMARTRGLPPSEPS